MEIFKIFLTFNIDHIYVLYWTVVKSLFPMTFSLIHDNLWVISLGTCSLNLVQIW